MKLRRPLLLASAATLAILASGVAKAQDAGYFAQATYQSVGAATYAVPFPYLHQGDVQVFDGGPAYVGTITWPSSTTITLSPAPTAGHTVILRRVTPSAPAMATFSGGAIAAIDLNRNQTQALYLTQEAKDLGLAAGASPLPSNPAVLGNGEAYVSAVSGVDSSSGTQWVLAKATIQSAIDTLNGVGGTVHVGAGVYNLTAPLKLRPGVRLQCEAGATITQANGANLTGILDFSTYTANGASVRGCIVDGNRAGNTESASTTLVTIGAANDVELRQNTIKNGAGYGIVINGGLRPVIAENGITNFYLGALYLLSPVASTATHGKITDNRFYGPLGQHAIVTTRTDYSTIVRNRIDAFLQKGMVVNVTGAAVTWVSGPTFSTLNNGEFLMLNGGDETVILKVNSPTSLTLTLPEPNAPLTNAPASSGPGDLIGYTSSSFGLIAQNNISGGITGGIVISNFATDTVESTDANLITGNIIGNVGATCISLQSTPAGGIVRNTQLVGNQLRNCGLGTTSALGPHAGIGITDFSSAPYTTLLGTSITDNTTTDGQGSPTTAYWLSVQAPDGSVTVRGNSNTGTINNGVYKGVRLVTLAGWGSSATHSEVSYGDSFVVNVASSGTGQAAFPTIAVAGPVTPTGNPPVAACQDISNLATHNFVYNQNPGSFSIPGGQYLQWQGTPVAGNTYTFLCRG